MPHAYLAHVKPETRLTALEASFVGLERADLPMHVAALVELESDRDPGPIGMRDLRRHMASRLRRLPRFQRRIEPGPLGLWPRWSGRETVDLDAHLFHHELPRAAGEAGIARLCSELHSDPLPAGRPLWQIHLIDAGGRQAVLVKLHHAIADGIGGMHIARTLFDAVEPSARAEQDGPPRETPSAVFKVGNAVVGAAFTLAGGLIARPSSFNLTVGRERTVAFARLPMERLVALKARTGGSIDDVLLATIAMALRGSGHAAGDSRALRAMVPVSTWTPGSGMAAGNHVSAIFVDLPQDSADMPEVVARISASKSILRTAHAAAAMSLGVEAVGLLPAPLHRAVVRLTTALPFANLVVSDTPGPSERLALLGRPITACCPMIPLAANVSLSIAAMSMGGVMGVGVVADPRALPDAQRVARAIERLVRTPAEQATRRRGPAIRVQAA